MSLQPSLFARLTAVEAELSAMKDILAELKVNQDELRRDRDEWRWRAERLLADLQQGTWWRWCNRAASALDAGTARFRGVLADVQSRLSEMKANRGDLRHGRDKWLSGARGIPMDQRGSDSGGSASPHYARQVGECGLDGWVCVEFGRRSRFTRFQSSRIRHERSYAATARSVIRFRQAGRGQI